MKSATTIDDDSQKVTVVRIQQPVPLDVVTILMDAIEQRYPGSHVTSEGPYAPTMDIVIPDTVRLAAVDKLCERLDPMDPAEPLDPLAESHITGLDIADGQIGVRADLHPDVVEEVARIFGSLLGPEEAYVQLVVAGMCLTIRRTGTGDPDRDLVYLAQRLADEQVDNRRLKAELAAATAAAA